MCYFTKLVFFVYFFILNLKTQEVLGASLKHKKQFLLSHTPGLSGHHGTRIEMPSGDFIYLRDPVTSKHWTCGQESTLIPLERESKEYNIIKKEMEDTWTSDLRGTPKGFKIEKIQRVVNPCLWHLYNIRKQLVTSEAGSANEKMLFHGTAAATDIAMNGFDERYASVGGYYGAGIYFTTDPSISHLYAYGRNPRQILLSRVTLGKIKKLNVVRRLAHAPIGFNSVQGTSNIISEMYVVYKDDQIYPEFLISYTTM